MYAPYAAPHPVALAPITAAPPKAPKPPAHPAAKWIKLMALFYALAFLFTLIAIFVPWSRLYLTNGATMWIGLWVVCRNDNNHLETTLCENVDVDLDTHPAGASIKCHDYYIATQVLTVITLVMAFLGLIVTVLLLKRVWTKTAMAIAGFNLVWWLQTFACAIAAWSCWLVYGEEDCAGTPVATGISGWPIQGYSYGFILMCFTSFWILFGLVLNCLALSTLKKPVYAAFPAPYPAPYPAYSVPAPPSYPVAGPAGSISPYMAPTY